MSKPIILLRGLPGSGKTTTSALLRDMLAPAVRVSNDAVRYLAKPRDFSAMSIRASERGCVDLAASYARSGFVPVIDGVFYDLEFIESVRWEMSLQGISLLVYTLVADIDELLYRNENREELARLPAERIQGLHDGFSPAGTGISIDDKPAEEVAEDVRDLYTESLSTVDSSIPSSGLDILFLRHAEPAYPEGHYPDHLTMPLTSWGRAQAVAARGAVERFKPDEIYASDMSRAFETATIAAETSDTAVLPTPELRERWFTCLKGLSHEEIDRRLDNRGHAVLSNSDLWSPEGEETLDEAAARVNGFVGELAAKSESRRILIVAHGGPHAWIVCNLLGVPLRANRSLDLGHAAFSHFNLNSDGSGRIRFINRDAVGVGDFA